MRNLALAFGLVLFFAVTAMAAPPQPSSCKITTSFTTKGCSAAERKLIQTTQAGRPTTKQVNIGLARLAAKEYLVINTICDLKGGRRKVARRLVEKCYDRVSEGQRLILRNAINNLQDIKACKGVKALGQQVNCMIDQDNKLLLPLIEDTLDAQETYMKGLKFMIDIGCSLEGGKLKCASSAGLIILILFYTFMGWVGRIRSVLIIVVAAIGCLAASVAEGACTAGEAAINDVAAQYGLVRYDCDDVPQAFKDAVFDVIWRGFVAKGGLKMGMSKSYIRSRWKRAEGAFWKVWSDAPLWQARIAAAICTKEYLCGVTIKFSDWDDFRFESPVNNDGTIDCGITQINSNSTSYSCDELQNLETAFKEQKRIIMLKVRGSSSKKVWKKRIHRYNHKTNYEYGKVIWDWSGASFGWFAILMGLFRRRQGQGDVGLAREEGDWQKRAYPVPKWGGHNEDPFQWVPEEEPSPTHCPGCGQEGGACFSIVCGAVYSPDSDED